MIKFFCFIFIFFNINQSFAILLKAADFRTEKAFLIGGISQGDYTGGDSFYSVEFKTIPRLYGLQYRNGTNNRFWELTALSGSFLLKGEPYKTFSALVSYSYQIKSIKIKKSEFFIGPTLRNLSFSRIHSDDGVNTISKDISQLSLGVVFSYQKRINLSRMLYAQTTLDIPVIASEVFSPDGNKLINYGIKTGFMTDLDWNISFAQEIQYRVDQSSTMNEQQVTTSNIKELSLFSSIIYGF